jgi:hypothetical protein
MTGFYDIEWTDCYQITEKQSLFGQLVINRFFFKSASEYTGSPVDIVTTWHTEYYNYVKEITGNNFLFVSTQLLQLYGIRQSYEQFHVGQTGDDGGAELPTFFGARFRLIPNDTRIRKGRKINAGVTEAMVSGLSIDAAYAAAFAAVAYLYESNFVVGGITFSPVLLSPANTRHTGNVVSEVIDALWADWSSQSSRKVGRGA